MSPKPASLRSGRGQNSTTPKMVKTKEALSLYVVVRCSNVIEFLAHPRAAATPHEHPTHHPTTTELFDHSISGVFPLKPNTRNTPCLFSPWPVGGEDPLRQRVQSLLGVWVIELPVPATGITRLFDIYFRSQRRSPPSSLLLSV